MMTIFSSSLIVWYKQHKRELPWRTTQDPYFVWISEIILQQTRVNQGLDYYFNFTKAFPTIHHLANADEDEVLRLWQGLGYYSRARNMHKTAKTISIDLNGEFPTTYNELLKLKGVGPYTAAAISSFCFNEHRTVVDGNVFRVLSRLFAIHTPINSTKGKKEFEELAHSLNDGTNSAEFNQAIMEFGALHCKPKQPLCNTCIFSDNCMALQNQEVTILPKKEKKLKIKERYLNFMMIIDTNGQTVIKKRTDNDIWKGLYQFPIVETLAKVDIDFLFKDDATTAFIQNQGVKISNHQEITHQLTHQKLHISITQILISQLKEPLTKGYLKINENQLKDFAFPKPLHSFITKFALK